MPLWRTTANLIRNWKRRLDCAGEENFLFPNRGGGCTARSNATQRLELAVSAAAERHPQLASLDFASHHAAHHGDASPAVRRRHQRHRPCGWVIRAPPQRKCTFRRISPCAEQPILEQTPFVGLSSPKHTHAEPRPCCPEEIVENKTRVPPWRVGTRFAGLTEQEAAIWHSRSGHIVINPGKTNMSGLVKFHFTGRRPWQSDSASTRLSLTFSSCWRTMTATSVMIANPLLEVCSSAYRRTLINSRAPLRLRTLPSFVGMATPLLEEETCR